MRYLQSFLSSPRQSVSRGPEVLDERKGWVPAYCLPGRRFYRQRFAYLKRIAINPEPSIRAQNQSNGPPLFCTQGLRLILRVLSAGNPIPPVFNWGNRVSFEGNSEICLFLVGCRNNFWGMVDVESLSKRRLVARADVHHVK